MSTTILRAADLQRVPWRNGQGMTTEIALGVPEGSDAEFDWRISLAEVGQSGAFSAFPGIDRIITLIDGPPMTLHLPDQVHVLDTDQPFAFDGGLPVHCEVERPTRDLNVMTRRGAVRGGLVVQALDDDELPVGVPKGATVVVVVIEGAVTIDGTALHSGNVVITTEDLSIGGRARVAVATITPADLVRNP